MNVGHPNAADLPANGTLFTTPWKSIHYACAQVPANAKIYISYGTYRPVSAGGFEATFPIVVNQNGVKLIGLPDAQGNLPVLTANGVPSPFPLDTSVVLFQGPGPGLQTNNAFRWLEIDNTFYQHHSSDQLRCLTANGVDRIDISDCRFTEGYWGVWVENPSSTLPATITIQRCEASGFGPYNQVGNDVGHAAIVINGKAVTHATINDCLIFGNHDGIEGGKSGNLSAMLTITACEVFDNENGIEAFDNALTVTNCHVHDNFAQPPPGGLAPQMTTGIALRGSGSLLLRNNVIERNAAGVLIAGNTTGPGPYDLGTLASPGRNTIQSVTNANPDPNARTGVAVSQLGASVSAIGNTWVPLRQGADSGGSYSTFVVPSCSSAPCGIPNAPTCTTGYAGNNPSACSAFDVVAQFPINEHANWALGQNATIVVK